MADSAQPATPCPDPPSPVASSPRGSARALRVWAAAVGIPAAVLLADLLRCWGNPGVRYGRLEQVALLVLSFAVIVAAPIAARPRPTSGVARRLLLALSAGGVALLGSEAVLAAVSPRPTDRGFAAKPFMRRITHPSVHLPGIQGDSLYTTNSVGLRGPEWGDDDDVRILVVGGSTAECLYLDDAEAWPALLQVSLATESGRRVSVGNAGQPGRNSWDHLVLVEGIPEAGACDLVIVLCGWNDVCQVLGGSWASVESLARERAVLSYRVPAGSPLLHRSAIFFRLRQAMSALKAYTSADRIAIQDDDGAWVAARRKARLAYPLRDRPVDWVAARRAYGGVLERIVASIRRRGAVPVLLTQPTLISERMTPEQEGLLYMGALGWEGFTLPPESFLRGLRALNAEMVDVAGRMGVECIRLDLAVPSDETAFYDDCHFNEGGARAVAAAVSGKVLPLVKAVPPGGYRRGTGAVPPR